MLKTKHFFPFIKMVKALDIKNELKEFYQKTQGKSEKELEQLDDTESFDYLYIFIEKLPNAEKEVMSFLGIFLEKKQKEIDDMEILEMFNVLKDVIKDPSFKTFFQTAVK
ncbi:hypothetical protein [Salipaludibacillus sp. CF4.18]|uniref:hypothetical protein n=1 Tax=Salipaludibacillus sp. CF4.18 TaxID=3373081 RepID=UPI003EE7076A